jgi:hypothetical protein
MKRVALKMKKSIMAVFFICQIHSLFGQQTYSDAITEGVREHYIEFMSNIGFSTGDMIIYNGFWDVYDKEGLHDLDLAVLSKEKLRLLRNAIYARRGLIFKSSDLNMLFSRFEWYKPRHTNVDDLLTGYDKGNIRKIQAYENAVPNREITVEDLVGTWDKTGRPLPAGTAYAITIYPDYRIEFYYNTMVSQAAGSAKGTYRLENGFLVVLITEQRLHIGGYFESGYSRRDLGGDTIYATLTYDKPVRAVLPIGKELYETYTSPYDGKEYEVKNRVIGSGLSFYFGPPDSIH